VSEQLRIPAERFEVNLPRLAAILLLTATFGVHAAEPPGRVVAHDQERGNCLACHRIPADPGAETLATMGPPLEDIRHRFPDRAQLRQRIWDARAFNPETIMPPYGRHRILTEEEIDQVVDYLHGL
jgi:sulfur-oxidizing protein SoxX